MKVKLKYIAYLFALGLVFGSCGKYTDIVPKGTSLMDNAADLDRLLNTEFGGLTQTAGGLADSWGNAFHFGRHGILINDSYPQLTHVPNLVNGNVRNIDFALVTYDESIDRAQLTATDNQYEILYRFITRVANAVLVHADAASGDPQVLRRLKAEAYILRAYFHYLLVNMYAHAYNPSTAATDGGIPYVTDLDIMAVKQKLSMQEVYEHLLSDIDAAFELNALVDVPANNMRVGKAFANAVKARVLLSMRNYPEALIAANEGLVYNSTIEDHRPFLPVEQGGEAAPVSRLGITASDNLFFAYRDQNYALLFPISVETINNYFEPENIILHHTAVYDFAAGLARSAVPGSAANYALSYRVNPGGMTTRDLYAVKAECLIREGQITEAMAVINNIRQRRVYNYQPLVAANQAQAMSYLQKQNRVEFLFTWQSFVDIKRWNREGSYPVVITRTIDGTTYTLGQNSPLWVFPFPMDAMQLNPTLTQNY